MGGDSWSASLKELGVQVSKKSSEGARRLTRGNLEKKERREKSRRWTAYSGKEALLGKIEARMERLESTNVNDALVEGDRDEDDLEDDLFEGDENAGSSSSSEEEDDGTYQDGKGRTNHQLGLKRKKKKRGAGKKRKRRNRGPVNNPDGTDLASSKRKPGRKRIRVQKSTKRPLHDILLDENARKLSQAKIIEDVNAPDYFNAAAPPSKYPAMRLCSVSGVLAPYVDPESGLSYSSSIILSYLREQPPPWVKASTITPYHDAIRIALDEQRRACQKLTKN